MNRLISLPADKGREEKMDDTRDGQRDARAPSGGDATARPRRPWVPPTLTRHASLTALTLQYPQELVVDPQTGQLLDPNNPEDRARLAQIPGSTGFFP
jgi:hypothetical protein